SNPRSRNSISKSSGRRHPTEAASIRRCAVGDDAERNFSAFTIGRLPAFPRLELVILVMPMEKAVVCGRRRCKSWRWQRPPAGGSSGDSTGGDPGGGAALCLGLHGGLRRPVDYLPLSSQPSPWWAAEPVPRPDTRILLLAEQFPSIRGGAGAGDFPAPADPPCSGKQIPCSLA
ncbi:unnamed protein product, partial [Urochloa humidicola]